MLTSVQNDIPIHMIQLIIVHFLKKLIKNTLQDMIMQQILKYTNISILVKC